MSLDQIPSKRRLEMYKALKISGLLFLSYLALTLSVVFNTPIRTFDQWVHKIDMPNFPWIWEFTIRRIDDLGLRGLTAPILIILAIFIGRRFQSWRPLNLAILAILLLNLLVGASKIGFGRTKPRLKIDELFADGLSYPSGHSSNALLTWGLMAYFIYRYTHKEPFQGFRLRWAVAVISLAVCAASILRDTHWVSDLIGGLFVGGAILVLVIAIDRAWPSKKQPS
ncbi:MAG: phosphatase PAP2 family protein [Actinomycetota bacterium]|jgi:membrane-associated phospholipid phosphatase|nr:phosphatase PAP2 family protein [Actinomycetota bacterium]